MIAVTGVDLARNWYFANFREIQASIKFLLVGCQVREVILGRFSNLVSIAPGKYLFSFRTQKSSPVAAIILPKAGN